MKLKKKKRSLSYAYVSSFRFHVLSEAMENNQEQPVNNKKRAWVWLAMLAAVLFLFFLLKAGAKFEIFGNASLFGLFNQNEEQEKNTINTVIFGLRGKDDPNGGLLTDTIMLVRYHTEQNRAALISIPRDLYVEMPGLRRKEKINFAYELGEKQKQGGGLEYAKQLAGGVCGLNVDYAVAVDFAAFEKIVDQLGGIDVTLEKDFSEPSQWGGINFYLPAGKNHLDGQTALYYVRSRFSTNDFDRARRQQEILLAIKEKAFSLGILTNPFRVYNISKTLAEHVHVDFGINEMITLINIANRVSNNDLIKKTFNTSENGLLYSTFVESNYVLLPKNDDFNLIKNACQNVFTD